MSPGEPGSPREVIEVRVPELRHLFNAIDPAPFHQKDLDPKAEEFIVGWAREAPRDARLSLQVYLDRTLGVDEETKVLREAIREFFRQRALTSRRELRRRFAIGRTSLAIGLACLALSLLLGDIAESVAGPDGVGQLLRESLLIGGWVAMWRPMEMFLYDWWPIRAEIRLLERLSAMPVGLAIGHPPPSTGASLTARDAAESRR